MSLRSALEKFLKPHVDAGAIDGALSSLLTGLLEVAHEEAAKAIGKIGAPKAAKAAPVAKAAKTNPNQDANKDT